MKPENVERISPDTLSHLIEKATPIQIVDIRNDEAYGNSNKKINGSIRATFETLDDVMKKLNKDIDVITYCTWPEEGSSSGAAVKMLDAGFKSVKALDGGFDAWKDKGYPLEQK